MEIFFFHLNSAVYLNCSSGDYFGRSAIVLSDKRIYRAILKILLTRSSLENSKTISET